MSTILLIIVVLLIVWGLAGGRGFVCRCRGVTRVTARCSVVSWLFLDKWGERARTVHGSPIFVSAYLAKFNRVRRRAQRRSSHLHLTTIQRLLRWVMIPARGRPFSLLRG